MGNREALMEGAMESLLEKGYAGTTARDVAARAGTSLAAIGYHFGSTQQLLHEAIANGFRKWREHLTLTLESHAGEDPRELLAVAGDAMAQLFTDDRRLFTVFLEALALAERSDEVQAQGASAYEEDRKAVAALVEAIRGAPSTHDRTVASVLIAVVDGLLIQHLLDPEGAPSPRAAFDVLAPLVTNPVKGRRR